MTDVDLTSPPAPPVHAPGERARNAHAALLACNKVLMAARSEDELFLDVCKVMVEDGGYAFAWVGLAEDDAEKSVRPVAIYGASDSYLKSLKISWGDGEFGRGPVGRSIRTGKPAFIYDVATDPYFAPWRDAALEFGLRSLMALPLLEGDRVFGSLAIYSREPYALESYETGLLMAAANTLAYGVTALRGRAALADSQASLEERKTEFQALLDNIADCYYRTDAEGRVVMANRAGSDVFGLPVDELLGRNLAEFYVDPGGRAKFLAALEAAGGRIEQYELPLRQADGNPIWVSVTSQYRRDSDGGIIGVEGIVRDITEQHRMQETLRESEARFRDFASVAANWLWEMGPDLRFTFISEGITKLTGEDPEIFIGKTRRELFEGVGKPLSEEAERHLIALEAHEPFESFVFKRLNDATGEPLHLSVSGKPLFDGDGVFKGYRGTTWDVTAVMEARERADLEQSRFLNAIESIEQGIALWDGDEHLVACNDYYRKLAGGNAKLLEPGIAFESFLRQAIELGELPEAESDPEGWIVRRMARFRDPQGSHEVLRKGRWYQVREQRMPDGSVIQVSADIHDIKTREQRLRETHKMEAIGHLAAGIAHEFNNLLMVVLGNLQMLERSPDIPEAKKKMIVRAKEGAQRGARLTDQLLAASSRRVLSAETLDLRTFLAENTQLLRSMMSERIVIDLQADMKLGRIEADPQELRGALVALALNARDAMPEGGELTLKAQPQAVSEGESADYGVPAGNYVMISVSDTGRGMAPEVQAHAFDPFFTTKEVGKGTGLGLSAVHGFARQSGGNAKIESTQGEGTTVYLYLPQAAAAQDGEAAAEQAAKPSRILVVEDDPNVRSTVLVQLDNLGYDTIEAEDGRTALEVLQSDEVIDLLFTDVVMPGGLNGVELAREARSLRPGLKVVFSSGYSQDALRPTERLDNGDILLKKPYLQDALASTIREALGDGGEGGDTPEAA